MRFKDGDFLRGFNKAKVEEGTRLKIAPTSVQDGYVRWEDGKPVDWRLREWVRTDQLPIFRDTLPDADKIGESDDPWSYCLLLAMKDEDGELVKFSTGSVGGTNAVRRVLRDWKRQRDKHPGKVPIVALSSGSYEHKVHRTEIAFPIFTIVDWDFWDEADTMLPSYTTADDPRTQVRDEIDDDLPF